MTPPSRNFPVAVSACQSVLDLRAVVSSSLLWRAIYVHTYAGAEAWSQHPLWDTDLVEATKAQVPDRRIWYAINASACLNVVEIDGIHIELPTDAMWSEEVESWLLESSAMDIGSQPGYMSRSSLEDAVSPPANPVRVYFAAHPVHAQWLLGEFARSLRAENKLGWAVKVAGHPMAYSRADAAVAYIHPMELRNTLVRLRMQLKNVPRFRNKNPLFTRRFQRGISLAKEPPMTTSSQQQSHGTWVTDCLIRATDSTTSSFEAATRLVEILHDQGRSIHRPWGLLYA